MTAEAEAAEAAEAEATEAAEAEAASKKRRRSQPAEAHHHLKVPISHFFFTLMINRPEPFLCL